jgi:hypothetical protein
LEQNLKPSRGGRCASALSSALADAHSRPGGPGTVAVERHTDLASIDTVSEALIKNQPDLDSSIAL